MINLEPDIILGSVSRNYGKMKLMHTTINQVKEIHNFHC